LETASKVNEGVKRIIKIEKFGQVDQALVDKVLDVMAETYERLGPPMTFSVSLRIFEKSIEGVSFFASHDASQERPTINVYADKILGLSGDVIVGGIRRQAAHSILHGSPEFYRIKLPSELRRAMVEYGLPEAFATKILYGVSMAAKEYAVTKFLISGDFIEDQLAYIKYLLEPIPEELVSWEIARASPFERIAYVVMTIRDMSCALPLAKDERFGGEIKAYMEKKIEHLPSNYKVKVRRIVNDLIPSFGSDLFKNIELLANAVVRELIDEELAFYKKTSSLYSPE